MKKTQSGFTLIELLVVIGIILVLFGIIVINLSSGERTFSVTSSKESLISDINLQQSRAMQKIGGGDAYGIFFQPKKYTLFEGESYQALDPENYEVDLTPGIEISSIGFPGATIVFATRSGEINGFLEGNDTITIQDQNGAQVTTIIINRYGVISGINQ